MPQLSYLLLKTCLLSVPCYLLMMKLCHKGQGGSHQAGKEEKEQCWRREQQDAGVNRAPGCWGEPRQDAGVNLHDTSGIADNLALLEVGCKLKSNGK